MKLLSQSCEAQIVKLSKQNMLSSKCRAKCAKLKLLSQSAKFAKLKLLS